MHLGESMCEDTHMHINIHKRTHTGTHTERERGSLLFYIHQEVKYFNQWGFEIRIITINIRDLKEKKNVIFVFTIQKILIVGSSYVLGLREKIGRGKFTIN